jgi:hypothetical protein
MEVINSWLRQYAKSKKVAVSIPDEAIGFSNRTIQSSCTMALLSNQLLTEISTRNLPGGGGKGRSALKAHNLTVICEQIV